MQIMKKILLFTIALFCFASIAYTCWYDGDEGTYKFVKQEIISDPTLLLFVDYDAGLWFGYSNEAKEPEDANLIAWKNYLKAADLSEADLAAVIYEMPENQLALLVSDKKNLAAVANDNELFKIWSGNKRLTKSMGNYLLYAKSCEVEANKNVDYWDKTNARDEKNLNKLLEQGLLAAKGEKDNFIKRRYALQALRMAFYANDYKNVFLIFDQYFANGEKDYTYYRALEQKAGVLTVQGEPEAAYCYAAVFANCPDRRNICLNSFQFTNSEDWERSIRLCKNDEEKTVFHTMRALQAGANIVEEMEAIALLTPASPYLELLFARHITHIQSYAFPAYISEYKAYPSEDIETYYEIDRLKNVCNLLRLNSNLPNHDFWQMAAAYAELLNRNHAESMKLLSKVPQASPYYKEAKLLRFVAQLCALDNIDISTADGLWGELQADDDLREHGDLQSFAKDVFAMHFEKQQDLARAFLVQNELTRLQSMLDLELLNKLEEYIDKTASSGPFDKYLVSNRTNGRAGLDEVYQMRGVYYLQHNQLDKAIEEFEKCSVAFQKNDNYFNSAYLDKSIWSASIFQPYFDDEIEGQPVDRLYEKHEFLNKGYNLLTYTQTLKNLEQRAKTTPAKAAEYYYLLGIAWYNTSPYGWNRPAYYFAGDNS